MSIRLILTKALQFFRQIIYRPLLRPIARRTGSESYLRDVYWRVFLTLSREQMVTVENITAQFRVHSRAEYWRTKDFVGERPILTDVLSELYPDDVFYDVGANIGLYSCLAARRLSGGRVIAFEPHPQTADRLRTNLALNGDDYDVYEYALSSRTDTMKLAPPEGGNRPGTYRLDGNGEKEAIPVQVIRGDELRDRAGIPKPTVVKIDVEGAEMDVIEGMKDTLSEETCRLVYIEIHPEILSSRDASRETVEFRLRELGFEVSTILSRGSEMFLKAER